MSDAGNGPPDPNVPGWGTPAEQPGGWAQPPAQPGAWGQPPAQPGYGPPPGYGAPPGFGPPPAYGYAQPGWAPPGYGYGAPQTDGKAIGALVCSILAWVFCPVILAIVGLALASQSSRDIRQSGGRLTGAGLNTAARIVAWLNIAFGAVFVIFILAAAGSTSSQY